MNWQFFFFFFFFLIKKGWNGRLIVTILSGRDHSSTNPRDASQEEPRQ
jgi:hypothetical protein